MSKKVQPKVLNKNCDIFVQSPNKSMHLMVPPSQKDEPNKIVQPGRSFQEFQVGGEEQMWEVNITFNMGVCQQERPEWM